MMGMGVELSSSSCSWVEKGEDGGEYLNDRVYDGV